ncbi:SH3 domain-containing protein [Sphingomonas sp.]|uniref:SH3 domain-containing protein n=1 Tax=Sphingomonas sp. TaxID=28214 RepID=UPI003B3A90F0
MIRRRTLPALALLAFLASPVAAQERAVPYWASIAAGKAMMRTGPERTYPGIWLYQRRDLPVRVLQVMGAWRRVQEQDGTTGWMLATLLSARRTGIVTGGIQPIREEASPDARLLWRAEPGVIGRIETCDGRWCRVAIADRRGFIEQAVLWGIEPGETIED